jgi:hypothetical protein
MSVVSEVLRNEETRAGGRRTVAEILNSVETWERGRVGRRFPKRRSGRDPLGDARKRVRMLRRGMHGIQLLGAPVDATRWRYRVIPSSLTIE